MSASQLTRSMGAEIKQAYDQIDTILAAIEACFDLQTTKCNDPDKARALVNELRTKLSQDLRKPFDVDLECAMRQIAINLKKFRINSNPGEQWLSEVSQSRSELNYRMGWKVKA